MSSHSSTLRSLPPGGTTRASSWARSHKIVAGGSTTSSSPADYDILTSDCDHITLELLMLIVIEEMFCLDMEEERMLSIDEQSLREFLKA
jgi:hypothetical protein